MAKKLNADEIYEAICSIEENTREATLTEVRDELRDMLKDPVGWELTEEHIPGLEQAIGFLTENYALKG